MTDYRVEYALKSLDNRVIATVTSGTLQGAFNGRWHWVQDVIADHFHAHIDDVHCEEDADGDLITVNGDPVALLFWQ